LSDTHASEREPLLQGLGVKLVAASAACVGLLDIWLGINGDISDSPLSSILPLESHLTKSLIICFGLILTYLAVNLRERKKTAWILALSITLLSLATHLIHKDLGAGVWALGGLAILLVALRADFSVKSESQSIRKGIYLSIGTILLTVIYGTLGFFVMDKRDFGIDFSIIDSIRRTLDEFFLMGNADLVPATHHAKWFLKSLNIAGATTIFLIVTSLFRPLKYHFDTQEKERKLALSIAEKNGRSSMDFYKTMPDKSLFFSQSGNCFVSYGIANDVVVVLADPVGPADELKAALQEFVDWVTDSGWLLCFLQAEPECLELYKSLGFEEVKIGEEARVDIDKFTTETIKKKDFKGKENKFKGFSLVRHEPPHSADLMDTVESISNEWLALPGRGEHRFTLGQFERSYIQTTPLICLNDSEGKSIAFVNEARSYYPGEITIDLMRHRNEVPSGTMDYLFLKLLQSYKEKGYHYFNLGLAALSGVGDDPDASLKERALYQLCEHLNKKFSYKGLQKYKQKFDPIWESRYFVYRGGPAKLLRCVLAFKKVTGY
jgi:phosphatidylglycerol lysyltransferase